MERVNEIEREIAELKKMLGTADDIGDVSWKITCLENEKGALLRWLKEAGRI